MGEPAAGSAPQSGKEGGAIDREDLIRRGRIDVAEGDSGDAPIIPAAYTTHEIRTADGALELRRTRFDCGFGIH